MNPIKIDIWSDIVCPFCYIGKRKLEIALEQFDYKSLIEITWHSFQLNPSIQTNENISSVEYLKQSKGLSEEQVEQMINNVEASAHLVGLTYHLKSTKIANTFKAHRLIHWAHTFQKGNEMKEKLLSAYFIEGKNVDDNQTLITLANELNLNAEEAEKILSSSLFSDNVEKDIAKASEYGIRGVPFFVINQKYGISGAQDSSVFLNTLNKVINEN